MTFKTRITLRRKSQIGRGATMEGDSTFPVVIVNKVLGVGGYGIVTGLPRIPFKSEMTDYTRLGLATHIRAIIEENIPTSDQGRYKEFCEDEIAKVTDPAGQILLRRLCFEVTKLYSPMEDETTEDIWGHIATHRGLSLYFLYEEILSILDVLNSFSFKKNPKGATIIQKVSIYPDPSHIVNVSRSFTEEHYTIIGKMLNDKTKPRTSGPRMTLDDYNTMERIIPDIVCLPSMGEIPEYFSPIWVENFGSKMKFFMYQNTLRSKLYGLDTNGIVEWTIKNLVGMPFPLAKQDVNVFIHCTNKSIPGITRAIASPTLSFLENMFDFYGLGIVHNDFKGGNAMITMDDEIKFIDFGAVKSAGELSEKIPLPLYSDYDIWSPLNPLRILADKLIQRSSSIFNWKHVGDALRDIYYETATGVRAMYTRHAENYRMDDDYLTLYNSTKPNPDDDPLSDKANINLLLNTLNTLPHQAYRNFIYIDNTRFPETENYIGLQIRCFHRIFIKILQMKGLTYTETTDELTITDSRVSSKDEKEALRKEVVSELALRNDVFSVGLVLYKIANLYGGALAKSLEKSGKPFDISDKECLMLIGLLTLAGICTSIMVDFHHNEWLPDLKEYVGRLKRLLAGEDVSIGDLKPTDKFAKISQFDAFTTSPVPVSDAVAEASTSRTTSPVPVSDAVAEASTSRTTVSNTRKQSRTHRQKTKKHTRKTLRKRHR